jgi:hypothetical protein
VFIYYILNGNLNNIITFQLISIVLCFGKIVFGNCGKSQFSVLCSVDCAGVPHGKATMIDNKCVEDSNKSTEEQQQQGIVVVFRFCGKFVLLFTRASVSLSLVDSHNIASIVDKC